MRHHPSDLPDLAELLHENSINRPALGLPLGATPGGEELPFELMDGSIKRYPTRVAIPLPPAAEVAGLDLFAAIRERSAAREFGPAPLPLASLAQLLFHGNGIRETPLLGPYRNYRRNAPSAGNLGSVDLYPIVLNVDGLAPGAYHYQPVDHCLTQIAPAAALEQLGGALQQPEFESAAVIIALGSSLARVRTKYGIRGYRFACIDAGHVAQNLWLVATAQGLGACTAGGFADDQLNRLLDLDGIDEATLYLLAVGSPQSPALG